MGRVAGDGVLPVHSHRRVRVRMEEGRVGMGIENTPDKPALNPALHGDLLRTGGQEVRPDGAFYNALSTELDNKGFLVTSTRSEERRVGKECRARGSPKP